ncbi:DUF2306 domain-containing protein [Paenibacillus protaetiae]|uniref:DUF2306 domain-containing protein n=1 Tax=Paenibacillus protaetiae TaxID=2509456 RepID=A0A4P6EY36_9BACL|nr:DUF2306 domain-containing protein [Paenibacillus protaetiae]QAY67605.1 DUF2306 domain-containing protein [Paenibacillus protaetiae]
MRNKTSKPLYMLLLVCMAAAIGYELCKLFVFDPQLTHFLQQKHKTESGRPLHVPLWLTVMNVHVAFACLAAVCGALGFSAALRRRSQRFHKWNGFVYLASVLLVSLTSGYMAPHATGGVPASISFNLLSVLWPALTVTALIKAVKQQQAAHRRWMIRSFVFCFTNAAIHLFTLLLGQATALSYEDSYAISVYAAAAVLLFAAELIIRYLQTEKNAPA